MWDPPVKWWNVDLIFPYNEGNLKQTAHMKDANWDWMDFFSLNLSFSNNLEVF